MTPLVQALGLAILISGVWIYNNIIIVPAIMALKKKLS